MLYNECMKPNTPKRVVLPNYPSLSFCTTSQFQSLKKGFFRHCGPTAITNLLLVYFQKYDPSLLQSYSPSDIFLTVSKIGRNRLMFWNFDLFNRFGGTSDYLVPLYLKASFKHYGKEIKVSSRKRSTFENIQSAIQNGGLIYLELKNHPTYGNHHCVLYGYLPDEKMYLVSDGWHKSPRLFTDKDLIRSHFFAIYP